MDARRRSKRKRLEARVFPSSPTQASGYDHTSPPSPRSAGRCFNPRLPGQVNATPTTRAARTAGLRRFNPHPPRQVGATGTSPTPAPPSPSWLGRAMVLTQPSQRHRHQSPPQHRHHPRPPRRRSRPRSTERFSGAMSSPCSPRKSSPASAKGWATPSTQQLLQQPVVALSTDGDAPGDCLPPERFADVAVFGLSATIGGMTPVSSAC